jgi:hypothetical protein
MPLNSVQLYVQSLLDGLVVPGEAQPLKAYVTPPVIDKLNGPRAYVWGGRLRGERQTAPRGPAFKHLAWTIDVYVSYLTPPGGALADQQFPLIVDAIMAATWAAKIPLMIDSQGQPVINPLEPPPGASQILNIGEQFELEYPPERNAASLRLLYYTCRLGLDIYEVVQG